MSATPASDGRSSRKKLGQHLADNAGDHVAVLPKLVHAFKPERSVVPGSGHDLRHPLGRALHVRPDELAASLGEPAERAEDERDLAEQLEVARVIDRRILRAAVGETLRLDGIGRSE